MTALQKRVEAMEKVGAGPLADEALRKLIHLQLQKYEKQLQAALRELEPLERQGGMSSDANGGLVEMTERVLEAQGALRVTMYRHHWQDPSGRLVQRWDNAPHHPEIATFPHHLHDGEKDGVVAHPAVTGLEVLQRILEELEAREQAR